jgi:hypothetical protein
LRQDKTLSIKIKNPEFDEGISVVFADYLGLARDKKKKKTLFISYDLGGGTLDIAAAILWQTRKGLNWQDHGRLVGYAGDNSLGGDLITDVISQMLSDSISDLLLNRESLNIVFDEIGIYGIQIDDFDPQKAKVFFPVKYNRNWMRDSDYQFDPVKVKENIKDNSPIVEHLAYNIKLNYFSNYSDIFSGELMVGLVIAQENNGNLQASFKNFDIGMFIRHFFDKIKINLDQFLDYPIKSSGSSLNFRQKFQKSVYKMRSFIVSKINDVDDVRIILAGNGSRFKYANDSIQKLVAEIEGEYGIDEKIKIIEPDENAKKLVALGYSRKMASKIAGDFYPVYAVIQNPLYYAQTNIDPENINDIVFEPIFKIFEPFCKNILNDVPEFIQIESDIIEVNLEDSLMVQQDSFGYIFNIFSDKKDLPDYIIGSIFIPNDFDIGFKFTKEIDGEKYSCIRVQFILMFKRLLIHTFKVL